MSLSRRTFLCGVGGVLATPLFAHDRVHEVAIRDFAYEPALLHVRPGDHIRFTNHDLAPHTATAVDGRWDTGVLGTGDTVEVTVMEGWTPEYHCIFHPGMTARLMIVTP